MARPPLLKRFARRGKNLDAQTPLTVFFSIRYPAFHSVVDIEWTNSNDIRRDVLLVLLASPSASAHPMGNFSINHHSTLTPSVARSRSLHPRFCRDSDVPDVSRYDSNSWVRQRLDSSTSARGRRQTPLARIDRFQFQESSRRGRISHHSRRDEITLRLVVAARDSSFQRQQFPRQDRLEGYRCSRRDRP